MTQVFQVGDIVYVNEPTPEDFQAMEFAGLTYSCEHLVGKLAMVYLVKEVETTLVGLLPCDEDYEFKIQDVGSISYTGLGFGIASHLSLVRESKLRTYVVAEASQLPMANRPLPLAGTRITHRIELPDSSIIEEGAVVGNIYKEVHDLVVVFRNPREDDAYVTVLPSELRPPFNTF